MKILVFSDSHGKRDRIESAIQEHLRYGTIDHIFFLGDGLREALDLAKAYPALTFDLVCGNCDSSTITRQERAAVPEEKLVQAGAFRFLLMHGHRHDVKSEYQRAADYAIEQNVDILLFGHTHRAEDITIDGSFGGHVRMINPGSCGGYFNASYACLDLVGRDLICGFGSYHK